MTALASLALLATNAPDPGVVADLVNAPSPWIKHSDYAAAPGLRLPAYHTLFAATPSADCSATIYTDTYSDGLTVTTVITMRGDTADIDHLQNSNPRLYAHDQGDVIRLPGMRRQFIYDVNMTADVPDGRDHGQDYVVSLTRAEPLDIRAGLLREFVAAARAALV